MKDYQKLFAVRENNLTAEEIAGAETLVLFLCKGCIPALPKMNAPEYLVKAVDELLKNGKCTCYCADTFKRSASALSFCFGRRNYFGRLYF